MTESTGRRERLAERYARCREYIRNNWLILSDVEIGDALGVSGDSVAKYRQGLGLLRRNGQPEAKAASAKHKSTPLQPKGYTPKQIAWAEDHARPHCTGITVESEEAKRRFWEGQEAGLMLVHHRDPGKVAGT